MKRAARLTTSWEGEVGTRHSIPREGSALSRGQIRKRVLYAPGEEGDENHHLPIREKKESLHPSGWSKGKRAWRRRSSVVVEESVPFPPKPKKKDWGLSGRGETFTSFQGKEKDPGEWFPAWGGEGRTDRRRLN